MDKKRKTRLNLRIDEALLEWVKLHADKNSTTVTEIVVRYFKELKDGEVSQRIVL